MGEATSNKVLVRKVAVGRENHQAKAMTVHKALRLSTAKVAEELHDLPLATLQISMSEVENADLPDTFTDGAMLLLLDGPRRQAGLALVDAGLAGALVQQQTTGTVRETDGTERRLTRTDAALVAPLLDGLIERVTQVVERDEDAEIFRGFQFGAMVEDARLAHMALEAHAYHKIAMTLDVAKGACQSALTLLLPIFDADEVLPDPSETEQASASSKKAMVNAVLQLEADIDMVLCRMRLPLGTLETLEAGYIIQLPPNSFPDVTLTDINKRAIGKGVVGQIEGQRAVQVSRPPVYADTPMRRESDRADLDLPNVQTLSDQAGPLPDFAQPELPDQPGLPELPAPPPDLPDLPETSFETDASPDLPDLPDLEALPELDDLPNLAELDNLPDLPELKTA